MSFWTRLVQGPTEFPDWYEPIDPDYPGMYQLTFGGMFEVAAGMAAAGFLDEEATAPELPRWEDFGLTSKRWEELSDYLVYGPKPGQPPLADALEPHERPAVVEYLARFETASAQPAPPGKALGYKFRSSDGWLVTPDECRTIAYELHLALEERREELVGGLKDRGYSRDTNTVWDLLFWWAQYNRMAADHGGYRIW